MIATLGPTLDGPHRNFATHPQRMRAYNALASVLQVVRRAIGRVASRVDRWEWAFSYCVDCGEHLYYGRTCRQVLGPKVRK